MKDLERLAARCEAELEAIGIRCGTVRSWSVNTRAKKRWGRCRQISPGVFDIDISERLLGDEVEDTAAKETIIHELLHTVEGCLGHKGKWKLLAQMVGRAYPQYHIKRTSSCEEKGISRETAVGNGAVPEMWAGTDASRAAGRAGVQRTRAQKGGALPPRYRITCTSCGSRAYRQRASRLIQRPEEFRCGRCGGKLMVEVRDPRG